MFCSKCGDKIVDGTNTCSKCGEPVNIFTNQADIILPASILRRCSNYLIDYLVITIISWSLLFLFDISQSDSFLISFFVYFLYYIIFESIFGKTIGKFVTKTKVVDRHGNRPTMSRVLGRTLSRLIPFDAISFLFLEFPAGWHDTISKTYVVLNTMTPEDVMKIRIKGPKQNILVVIIAMFIITIICLSLIGVFASVVLASLNTARLKSHDVLLKSNMSNIPSLMEEYLQKKGDYVGACNDVIIFSGLGQMSTSSVYYCNSDSESWVVSGKLKAEDSYWCVDSSLGFQEIPHGVVDGIKCDTIGSRTQIQNENAGEIMYGDIDLTKSIFMSSCSEGRGDFEKRCACFFDKFVERFGLYKFIEEAKNAETNGVLTDDMLDIMETCES